ncbi:MAG: class aldolase, partial [Rhizobacter sp.]|nr:class aldolase [Rhizobacter sp.]
MTPTAHPTDEATLRIELAACYRVFAMLGWTELIYNHITVRIPG